MATNCYMNADPCKGESTDDAHPDWIELLSFSHGLSQPMSGPSGTGGRAAARADFQNFRAQKLVDKATVDLHMHCAKGEHIPKIKVDVCQETGEKVDYWKYEFDNCLVQSIDVSGGGSERPIEDVSISYDKVSWTYTAVNNDGSAGEKIGPKIFNLATNKPE